MSTEKFDPSAFAGVQVGVGDGQHNQGGQNPPAPAATTGAEGSEDEDDFDENEDYKPDSLFQDHSSQGNLSDELEKLGYKPGDNIQDFMAKIQSGQSVKAPLPEGVNEQGYTTQDVNSLSRLNSLLSAETKAEDRIRQAVQFQYKGRLTEDEIEEEIDNILSNRIEMIKYDDQIVEALRNQQTQIVQGAKQRLDTYQQTHKANTEARQNALYNSRNIFGSVLKKEVLSKVDQDIANGTFKEALSDPANEAVMALLWNHRELITESFKNPSFLEGIEEGKKNLFLRSTNSQIMNGGSKTQSKQTKGFNPKAFAEG